jgi:hypothetical protein
LEASYTVYERKPPGQYPILAAFLVSRNLSNAQHGKGGVLSFYTSSPSLNKNVSRIFSADGSEDRVSQLREIDSGK